MGRVGRALGRLPAVRSRRMTGVDRWRSGLVAAWKAGVTAVHGETLLQRHSRLDGDSWRVWRGDREVVLPLPKRGGPGRVRAIGAGKAAAALARRPRRLRPPTPRPCAAGALLWALAGPSDQVAVKNI